MSKKVSPKYYSTDWPVDLADRHSTNWNTAIDILRDRFNGRYFDPLDVLLNHNEKRIRTNVGFIVMTIDCLLMETLNQFLLGLTHTGEKYYKGNQDPNFKYNWQAFRDYFKASSNFTG